VPDYLDNFTRKKAAPVLHFRPGTKNASLTLTRVFGAPLLPTPQQRPNADVVMPERTAEQPPCQRDRTTGTCWPWKVQISEEECSKCSSGDAATKVMIIERATQLGVQRHRNIQACVFRGPVLTTQSRTCCGGTKTHQEIILMCQHDHNSKGEFVCYSCPNFKENTNAS